MDTNQTKAYYLRKAANFIERNPDKYAWENTKKCNCGILARQILGVTGGDLIDMLGHQTQAEWSHMRISICKQTGLPTNEVFAALFRSGFSKSDLVKLEFLDKGPSYDNAEAVINYMRRWADELDPVIVNKVTPVDNSSEGPGKAKDVEFVNPIAKIEDEL